MLCQAKTGKGTDCKKKASFGIYCYSHKEKTLPQATIDELLTPQTACPSIKVNHHPLESKLSLLAFKFKKEIADRAKKWAEMIDGFPNDLTQTSAERKLQEELLKQKKALHDLQSIPDVHDLVEDLEENLAELELGDEE